MKKDKSNLIEIKNMSEDFEKCRQYVEDFLKKEKTSKTIKNETLIVFEAIYYRILEQQGDRETVVKLQTQKKWGNTCILLGYDGNMFLPEEYDSEDISPEDKILNAYNDRIDYSYFSGYNNIRITIRHTRGSFAFPCILSALSAFILYTVLHLILDADAEYQLMENIVFPLETWCANLVLMVGAPVTFISFIKNLTDTAIIESRHSDIKKIRKTIIFSSMFTVFLALVMSGVAIHFIGNPQLVYKSTLRVDKSLPELLETFVPSDIFTPFMVLSPFPLLILAALVTSALCSIGKYFDRLKMIIDTSYALFSRMLAIVMYGLPLFLFLGVMDVLLSDGFSVIKLYLLLIMAVALSLLSLGFLYWLRLVTKKIPVRPFVRKLGPLIRENYRIGSSLDAAPFNIRYCARTWSMDRKKLEINIPVLAQINLDGNCFFITLIPLLMMYASDSEVTLFNMILVGILVFFLSLGAPNQPGSVLIGLLIVLNFMQAKDLVSNAFIDEVLFGGLLNIVNTLGDIVTVYEMEMQG